MEKNKMMFGIAVLVIGGGIAYYLYNNKKNKKALMPIQTPISRLPREGFVALKEAPENKNFKQPNVSGNEFV